MKRSDDITILAEALAAFHAEATNPVKDKIAQVRSEKGNYAYGFSDLADATNLCRPLLAKNGLSVTQELLTEIAGKVGARTVLLHVSGQWIEYDPLWIPVSGGPQQIGSAATYARRYAYLAALSLAPDDDDGANAQDAITHELPKTPDSVQESTLAHLRLLRMEEGVSDDNYATQLEKIGGVQRDTDLTQVAAKALITRYERHIRRREEAEAAQAEEAQEPDQDSAPSGPLALPASEVER